MKPNARLEVGVFAGATLEPGTFHLGRPWPDHFPAPSDTCSKPVIPSPMANRPAPESTTPPIK